MSKSQVQTRRVVCDLDHKKNVEKKLSTGWGIVIHRVIFENVSLITYPICPISPLMSKSICRTPLLYLYIYKVEQEVNLLTKGSQNDFINNNQVW